MATWGPRFLTHPHRESMDLVHLVSYRSPRTVQRQPAYAPAAQPSPAVFLIVPVHRAERGQGGVSWTADVLLRPNFEGIPGFFMSSS